MIAKTRGTMIIGVIARYKAERHIDATALAKAAGMGLSTYYKRTKDPEEFTVRQLGAIYDRLSVPAEERKGL